MVLALLSGCAAFLHEDAGPLTLEITSPTYGSFTGEGPLVVTGVVHPTRAQVIVNGRSVSPADDGSFTTTVDYQGQRAAVVDAFALLDGQQVRELVPCFDGVDPRLADPGAIHGLLTPIGLDALEPLVATQVDALGWEDLVFSALPAVDTEYLSITPIAVTSSGSTVDLAPAEDSIAVGVTFHDVTLVTDVDVAGWFTFPMDVILGEITVGAHATPDLDDDVLTLTLSDAIVGIDEIGLSFDGWDVPDWIMELLADPVAGLVADLGDTLGDVLLEQVPPLEVAGPFAFESDLMGVPLAARLVDVGADLTGVNLAATVSTDGSAEEALPDMPALPATTAAGLPYQLGVALHEGLLDALVDSLLGELLDFEIELAGVMGEALGGGIRALPGGDDAPPDTEGWCLALHVGDARVVRLSPGTGSPLAQVWLPDVRARVDALEGGTCVDWLDAHLFAVVDLSVDDAELGADFRIVETHVLAYGAAGVHRDDVAASVGALMEGFAGVFAGQLTADLSDLAGVDLGGVSLDPRVVAVEPLGTDGLFAVFLDVF